MSKDQVRSTKEALSLEQTLRLALEALESNRRTHHYCEDTWYSCPKHEDGCANDSEGDECNCGADEANTGIDQIITAIKSALEAKDEPMAWRYDQAKYRTNDLRGRQWAFNVFSQAMPYMDEMVQNVTPLYTTPPQRKPLTDEEIYLCTNHIDRNVRGWANEFARAIEAAHGITGDNK